MNRLASARADLFAALKPLLPDGRVTPRVPAQVVAPCIWIEAARLAPEGRGTNSSVLVATFPIVAVVDGSQDAQTVTTDEITARVWDAAEHAGATCTDAQPETLDVGGPALRAVTIAAAVTLRGRTLCPPEQEESR